MSSSSFSAVSISLEPVGSFDASLSLLGLDLNGSTSNENRLSS
ncbi:8277_t:CDS:1, partial [Funneliformis geosporum]